MLKRLIITSHVVYVGKQDVFGPGHAVSNYLKKNQMPHIYLRHSLMDLRPSEIIKVKNTKDTRELLKLPGFRIGLLRYPVEMYYSYRFYKRYKPQICIAIDPVNAFSAILARKSGFIKTVIFYTADYAIKRFENPVLNLIYHSLDKFGIRNADLVWNVSSRIQKRRLKQGVKPSRNLLIPNTPLVGLFSHKEVKNKIKHSMVLMANFTPAIDYPKIISVISELRSKFKDIHIAFIGKGGMEEEVREMVKTLDLEKNVTFHGFMQHDDALKTAAAYEIGLAPYANIQSWTEFGDSLKAREYMALGLPVIITNNVSTSDDIVKYNAGFSISMNKKELKESLEKLISDKKLYESMRKNALKLAEDYDLEKILDKELKNKFLQ